MRLITAILLFTIFIVTAFFWFNFLRSPLVLADQGLIYRFHAGASVKTLVNDLSTQKVIKHPMLFRLLVRLKGVTFKLKAGEYLFAKGTTPTQLLDQMAEGKGLVQHAFTIINGWNFRQLRAALDNEPALFHQTKNLDNAAIMKLIGATGLDPEGQFYPDTYFFIIDSSDVTVLKRAFRNMQAKLSQAWQTRAQDIPFSDPYAALIAASLIEKETSVDEERPIIAGVLVNRLKKQMLLQFDPTVIYGLGTQFDGKIYKKNLLANTPYNTYLHRGLPPTPIAMPSLKSIEAALHPAEHHYYYFVAREDHKSHYFSETLAEHLARVAEVRKYQNHANVKATPTSGGGQSSTVGFLFDKQK